MRTSQNTIDIRGSRVAEAEGDLERAIASATASGILWVIHGKGTGRLRQGVHEFLQRHPQVERFELAPQKGRRGWGNNCLFNLSKYTPIRGGQCPPYNTYKYIHKILRVSILRNSQTKYWRIILCYR